MVTGSTLNLILALAGSLFMMFVFGAASRPIEGQTKLGGALMGIIAIFFFVLSMVYILECLFRLITFVSALREFYNSISSNPYYVVIPSCIVAVLLYNLRGRYPFVYGLIECITGIVTVQLATELAADFLPRFIAVAGGIYIIVRGLENQSKAIPIFLLPFWRRIFFLPKAQLNQTPK